MQNPENHIAIFKGKTIRKIIHQEEWWFSILDIIQVITDSSHPKTYWAKMKERDKSLFQPFPFWEQLKLSAEDGKMRETDCANTEGLFRIIQNIPSPKVEPLKRWLAKVGLESELRKKFTKPEILRVCLDLKMMLVEVARLLELHENKLKDKLAGQLFQKRIF